jgi:manganese oxidase
MRRLLGISMCAIAVAAAGCGGGGGGGSSSTPASSAPASSAPAASGKTATVEMKNIQFNPKTLTVSKGTTVTWTNSDSVAHDVTKQTGPGPDFKSGSGDIGSGGAFKTTFNDPGTIKYECTVHPGMTGTIVVK